MRGKRSKTYRKLMQKYGLAFGIREPYQCLVDAGMLIDSQRFSMDLVRYLKRTLHGEVKPMISGCSIRRLFSLQTTSASASDPSNAPAKSPSKTSVADLPFPPSDPPLSPAQKTSLLNLSRTLTLRKCNHHTLEHPLSTLDCYKSFIDPKDLKTNKHNYCIAASDAKVRSWARGLAGVPLIYIKRSVMILEPMGELTTRAIEGGERGKLRGGLRVSKGNSNMRSKRKRDVEEDEGEDVNEQREVDRRDEVSDDSTEAMKKKKKSYGVKGPNPLSVKRKKGAEPREGQRESKEGVEMGASSRHVGAINDGLVEVQEGEAERKKKRRRKHKGSTVMHSMDGTRMPEVAVGDADEAQMAIVAM